MSKLLVLFLLASTNQLIAQHPNVEISTVANPNEISIAIHPKDPNKLLSAANINSVYTSQDGGLTWERKTQKSVYGVWGDPVVAIDTAGTYYHFHLSKVEGGSFIDRIVCQRSFDEGKTFDKGTYAGKNGTKAQDKHWVTIDPVSNTIHLCWTQFDKYDSDDLSDRSNILYASSTDAGQTWSEPTQINQTSGDCRDSDDTVEGAVPAVGPNGEVYVAWSGPAGLVFNSAVDNGLTWETIETFIDSQPGGWDISIPGIFRANGFPVTKCDISGGEHNGTIYVNWSDQRNGTDDTDIWLSKSIDGGKTWGERKRVNQDSTQSHQFFNWMDVDQSTGYLYFIYYDRRQYSDNQTDVMLAVSQDGGLTFVEHLISEKPFNPDSDTFFGDYSNIAAQNGVVRPVWTHLNGKSLSVKTAIVDSAILLNSDNASYSFEYDSATKNLILGTPMWTSNLVSIKNLKGETIQRWENISVDHMAATHLTCETALAPGIYYVEIQMIEKVLSRQLIVN